MKNEAFSFNFQLFFYDSQDKRCLISSFFCNFAADLRVAYMYERAQTNKQHNV